MKLPKQVVLVGVIATATPVLKEQRRQLQAIRQLLDNLEDGGSQVIDVCTPNQLVHRHLRVHGLLKLSAPLQFWRGC